jgi:hypothetical protein
MNKMLATLLVFSAAGPAVAQDYDRLLGGRDVPPGAQIRFAECPAGTRREYPDGQSEPICVVDRSSTSGFGSGQNDGRSATYSSGTVQHTSSGGYSGGYVNRDEASFRRAEGGGYSGYREPSNDLLRQPTDGRSRYADPRSFSAARHSSVGNVEYRGGSQGGRRMPGHPCVILDPVPTETDWNASGGPCRLVDIPRQPPRYQPPRYEPPRYEPPRYAVREDSYYRRETEHTRTRYAREWHGQDGRYWQESGGYSSGGHSGSCGCSDHHHDHHGGCGHSESYASHDGYVFPGVGGRSPVYFSGGGGGQIIINNGGGRSRSFAGSGSGSNANSNANSSASANVNVNTNVRVNTGIRVRGGGGGGHGGGYGGGGHGGGHGGGGYSGGGYGGRGGGGYGGGGYSGGGYGGQGGGGYGGGGYSGGGGSY